jgi:DNA repair exonuclease SbcCD ATPase subunit
LAQLVAAEQVELHLRSGQVVKGELVSQDNNKVVVKSTSVGKSGKAMSITMPYLREDIAEVVVLGDPEEVYSKRLAAAKSGADYTALALWCREQGMIDRATDQAERAVELDASQDAAAKLLADLGWVQLKGKWVKEAEALAAQGQVRYQGKVMTIAEADVAKALAAKQTAAQDSQKAADEKAGAVAYYDRLLVELKKRPPLLEAELTKATAELAAAQEMDQKAVAAKAALDAAQKALDQARLNNTPTPGGAMGGANGNNNLMSYTQAVEDAQKAYNAARRAATTADADIPRLKGKVAALNAEKKNLEKKQEELTAKRDKAIEAAKAATEATKPADAAKPDNAGAKPADAAKPDNAGAKPADAAKPDDAGTKPADAPAKTAP